MNEIPNWVFTIIQVIAAVLSLKIVEVLVQRYWGKKDKRQHTTVENEAHALAADTQFRADLMNRIKNLEEEQKHLQQEFHTQGLENTELKIENKHLQKTNARQETELDKLRIENTELKSSMQTLKQQFAVLQAEFAIVTTTCNNLQAEIRSLQVGRDVEIEKEILRRIGMRPAGVDQCVAIIDDDEATRGMFTTLLKSHNVQHQAFSNGKQALDWLREHEATSMVVDLALEGEIDGLSLLERIRGQERRNKRIPARIILYTGYTVSDAIKHDASEHNVEAILTKSIQTPDDVVAQLLGTVIAPVR